MHEETENDENATPKYFPQKFPQIYKDSDKVSDDTKNAIKELRLMLSQDDQRVSFAIYNGTDCRTEREKNNASSPLLIELAFKSGASSPEWFAEIIRTVYHWGEKYRRDTIKRMALLRASEIGVSYPQLYNSSTAGKLFLPSLVHLVTAKETALIITAETGGSDRTIEIVNQVKSLADMNLVCKYREVFGDRYVTITGPGMAEWSKEGTGDSDIVPAVLWRDKDGEDGESFSLDFTTLDGLVGLDSENIRRPGVHLQFFEGGKLHKKYNDYVLKLIQFAMGTEGESKEEKTPLVTMNRFDSSGSHAFHRSLNILKGAPRHNTILRTRDEFSHNLIDRKKQISTDEKEKNSAKKNFAEEKRTINWQLKQWQAYDSLYYRNVLLIACDEDTYDALKPLKKTPDDPADVQSLLEFWGKTEELTKEKVALIYDTRSSETASCLLMDGILCINGKSAPMHRDGKQSDGEKLKLNEMFSEGNGKSELKYFLEHLNALLPRNKFSTFQNDKGQWKFPPEAMNYFVKEGQNSGRFLIIGWYSQISEIIEYVRSNFNSNTSNILNAGDSLSIGNTSNTKEDALKKISDALKKIRLLPLPGGGFAGDWNLEVSPNSVSKALGRKILDELLTLKEDFLRFKKGVGLPCFPHLDNEFDVKDLTVEKLLKKCSLKFQIIVEIAKKNKENKPAHSSKNIFDKIIDYITKAEPNRKTSTDIETTFEQIKKDLTKLEQEAKLEQKDIKITLHLLQSLVDNLEKMVRANRRRKKLHEYWRETSLEVLAWHGTERKLKEVLEIHKFANFRSLIENYDSIQHEFSEIIEQLLRPTEMTPEETEKTATYIITLLQRKQSS